MGYRRDQETAALDNSRRHGFEAGRTAGMTSAATSLGLDPSFFADDKSDQQGFFSRIRRLEQVSESVGALLVEANRQWEIARNGNDIAVARFIISEQLPDIQKNNNIQYFECTSVYRLGLGDGGETVVMTEATGGSMLGSYTFGREDPLTTEWVEDRLATYGVQRRKGFCSTVVTAVSTQLNAEVDNG